MFQFSRELILPLFLQRQISISELAARAGVSNKAAERAVKGEKISASIVGKIAAALGVDAMNFLALSKD